MRQERGEVVLEVASKTPQRDSPGLEVETSGRGEVDYGLSPQRDSPGLEVETEEAFASAILGQYTHKGILQAWRLRPLETAMMKIRQINPQRDSPGLEVETNV